MSTFRNIGYSEIPASSHSYLRPPSSLSLPSNSGDSGFLPSRYGSVTASTTNSHAGISSTSGNTSIGSSPIPTEPDIDQVLRKAVELLTLRNEALKVRKEKKGAMISGKKKFKVEIEYPLGVLMNYKHADASSQLVDARYLNGVSGFYDFNTTNPAINDAASYEKQQANHLRSKRLPPFARKSPKPDSYKTVMCQAWLESGICSFAENCRFAHGEQELRPCKLPTKNPKYKTKLCDKYTMAGLCPYGDRCLFIHPEASNAPNPYMRPDRYLKMQRERAHVESINGISSETAQMLLSNRATNRPPPSWPLESPAFFSAHRDLDQLLKMQYFTENKKPSKNSEALAAKNLDHSLVLGDITNQTMVSIQATPNALSSVSTKVNVTPHDSPDSGISFRGYDGSMLRAAIAPQSETLASSDYPFQFAIHADNLARSLACEFKVD
uniref:C3H1-type domain-containing protein n=1 Tax=Setaria digitata TaxID=48799 RepID=A0A915Q3J9_9BILA